MSRVAPWAGWIGGIAGWFVLQQSGSMLSQLDCRRADLAAMLIIATLGAALAMVGGLISWHARRAEPESSAQPRRFVATTGGLAALIFLLAIVFQMLASLIIPRCHV